jgi:hypothetical protein
MARGDGDDHEGTMDRSIVIWSSDQVVEKVSYIMVRQ